MPRTADYLETVQAEHELTARSIAMLVNWMSEVSCEFGFQDETIYIACNIVERVLAILPMSREELQLMGSAALFLACKYEEVVTRSVDDFVFLMDQAYTGQEICDVGAL